MAVIRGTRFDDKLSGTEGIHLTGGCGGDETIRDSAGNDWIWGGDGSDSVNAGRGRDAVVHAVSKKTCDHGVYNSGRGWDTHRLTLTQEGFNDPVGQADLRAFPNFLDCNSNSQGFHFTAFDVTVRDLKARNIEIADDGNQNPVVVDDAFVSDDMAIMGNVQDGSGTCETPDTDPPDAGIKFSSIWPLCSLRSEVKSW